MAEDREVKQVFKTLAEWWIILGQEPVRNHPPSRQ
jgi:hypothetical protein